MAQMGRPKKEKPINDNLHIRIDKETNQKFQEYCEHNNTTKTKVLIKFIESLIGK